MHDIIIYIGLSISSQIVYSIDCIVSIELFFDLNICASFYGFTILLNCLGDDNGDVDIHVKYWLGGGGEG